MSAPLSLQQIPTEKWKNIRKQGVKRKIHGDEGRTINGGERDLTETPVSIFMNSKQREGTEKA